MSQTTMSQEPGNFAAEGHQFLTFRLQEEEYGIEILRVQEIKGFSRVTPIPNTPRFVRGVLNLRGEVVPILDLRTRFNMPETEYNQFTVIIVVNVASKIVGLVVDAVSDVLNVGSREIEPVPDLGSAIDISYLTGMAKAGERLITLLNIDKLIDPESKISMLGA
jgi:purine-binding chemotaxis protein CheW